jgi:hypothetical protein
MLFQSRRINGANRFVNGDVSEASLRNFLKQLEMPGFQARLYLAGDALHETRAIHENVQLPKGPGCMA